MDGRTHYDSAEELLDVAGKASSGSDEERYALAAAQVHATLALADYQDDLRAAVQTLRLAFAP